MSIFSNRLKSLRKLNAISQKNLAKILGISENSYQRYEYATREPDLNTIKKLAEYFQVSTDYLIGYGIFANWEEIVMYQNEIISSIEELYPSLTAKLQFPLDTLDLIRFLPALFKKIEIDKKANTITLYPVLAPDKIQKNTTS